MAKILTFYYISGRGWVTQDREQCRCCYQYTERTIERQATDAEKAGIILPALEKDPLLNHLTVRLDPAQWEKFAYAK